MRNKPIKVLVVDDSRVYRMLIGHALNEDPEIEVIGYANDGIEALDQALRLKPDLITIDVHMPRLGGFEATGRIMEEYPVPIVIVTAYLKASEVSMTFDALKSGAVGILHKPEGLGGNEQDESVKDFVRKIKLLSEIKVIRRHKRREEKKQTQPAGLPGVLDGKGTRAGVVLMGASAGGPPVLNEILSKLVKPYPLPVVLVQHVDPGFAAGFCEWLGKSTGLKVQLAGNYMAAEPGSVYLAPGDHHIGFASYGILKLFRDTNQAGHRPSVSYLFKSAKEVYGPDAVAILLTGMGVDGASEMKELREAGATTIAQDAASSLVYGMPGEAVKIGAAMHVLSPIQIIEFLNSMTR